jgi:sensor histidine kinase regulating citrate/malate metabolism
MIVKENKEHIVQGDTFKTHKSTINSKKMEKLYYILTSLYSNVIGSIVRESVSNAADANTAAKSDEPILVSLKQHESTWKFSVEDFGTGISPQKAEEIVFNFLESDKEESDDYIGGWG